VNYAVFILHFQVSLLSTVILLRPGSFTIFRNIMYIFTSYLQCSAIALVFCK